MYKKLTLALLLCSGVQVHAQSTAKDWFKTVLAFGAGKAAYEHLTDEQLFKVVNRLHDGTVQTGWFGKAKQKVTFWDTLQRKHPNQVRMAFWWTRIAGCVISYSAAMAILNRTPYLK